MLVARPSKRSWAEQLAIDYRFDIVAGERQLGRLVCRMKDLGATIELGGDTFVVEHVQGAESELGYEAVVRLARGRPKPPPGRHEMKDAAGNLLAVAEQQGEVFQVTRGAERFRFAKGRSRLNFNLWREGEPAPLGSIGQQRFWTTRMTLDLPDGFDPPFQAFLLVVLLGLFAQRAASSTSASI